MNGSPASSLATRVLAIKDSPLRTDAALALAWKSDTPDELKNHIINALLEELEEPGSNAAMINSAIGIARVWDGELSTEAAERLLKLLQSDVSIDDTDAFHLNVRLPDDRHEFVMTISRRILAAELLRAGCPPDDSLRIRIVRALAEKAVIDTERAAVEVEYQILDLLLKISGSISEQDIAADGSFSQAALFTGRSAGSERKRTESL